MVLSQKSAQFADRLDIQKTKKNGETRVLTELIFHLLFMIKKYQTPKNVCVAPMT